MAKGKGRPAKGKGKDEEKVKEEQKDKEEKSDEWKDWNDWKRAKTDKDEGEWKSNGWNNSSWAKKEDVKEESKDDESGAKNEWKSNGWSKSTSSWTKKEDVKEESKEDGMDWKKDDDSKGNSWGEWKDWKNGWNKDDNEKDVKVEVKKEENDWNKKDWRKNDDWRRDGEDDDGEEDTAYKWKKANMSERQFNNSQSVHGSEEWKKAVLGGNPGLPYKAGDEKLTIVQPRDFKNFTEAECATWKNKPDTLEETDSFWVFGKNVNWVCSNTSSQELKDFAPRTMGSNKRKREGEVEVKDEAELDPEARAMKIDGSLPAYVVMTYGRRYPFVCTNTEVFDPEDLSNNDIVKSGFGMLHRLDRETSGPVLVAKTAEGFRQLVKERDNHNWHKEYVTLCHGIIPPEKSRGVIDIPLRKKRLGLNGQSFIVDACHNCWKDPSKRKIKPGGFGAPCRRGADEEGYFCVGIAKSYYEVVTYHTYVAKNGETYDYTFVRIKLVSGKTHQIRVHMKLFGEELGLPICGVVSDFKYVKPYFPAAYRVDCMELCQRVWLHSCVLGFRDPDDPFVNRIAKFNAPNDLSCVTEKKMIENEEKMNEMVRFQMQSKKEAVAKFVIDFGLNADAEKIVRNMFADDQAMLLKVFYENYPDTAEAAAARSFNGDHSAMILRIVNDRNNDVDELSELIKREFPEKRVIEGDDKLALPDGWVRKTSRKVVGAVYYHNPKMNIVQIEHPGRSALDGLPPGWTKVASKSKPGQFYYYDSSTSTSHMTPPAGTCVYNVNKAAEAEQGNSQWEKKVSRSSGKPYWFNAILNRTSIHHPLGLEPLPEGWERQESSNVNGKYYFKNTTTDATEFAHPVSKKTWSDVPPPWQFAVSKNNANVVYWINTQTQETTQTHPVTDINVNAVKVAD